jgi:AcrR family transcriptional regulator
MKRVSKAEWLQASLDILETQGVEALRIANIAQHLSISKSGFYWHFKDRNDLRNQLIEMWEHESTSVGVENPLMDQLPPKDRLEEMMHMILQHNLGRYDIAMLSWGKLEPSIATRVRKVFRHRLDYIGKTFEELGYKGEELEMRTRLFVGYHAFERTAFSKESKKHLKALIKSRVNLLTRK